MRKAQENPELAKRLAEEKAQHDAIFGSAESNAAKVKASNELTAKQEAEKSKGAKLSAAAQAIAKNASGFFAKHAPAQTPPSKGTAKVLTQPGGKKFLPIIRHLEELEALDNLTETQKEQLKKYRGK